MTLPVAESHLFANIKKPSQSTMPAVFLYNGRDIESQTGPCPFTSLEENKGELG